MNLYPKNITLGVPKSAVIYFQCLNFLPENVNLNIEGKKKKKIK